MNQNGTGAGRLDVFEVSGDTCVAVGSDGQLWRIASPLTTLRGNAGREVLDGLREQLTPFTAPPCGYDEVIAASGAELQQIAHDLDHRAVTSWTVLFPFAGSWYRLALVPGSAARLARLAVECLLSTIADPTIAEALLRPAVLVDPVEGEPPGSSTALQAGPEVGMLHVWRGDAWQGHPLDPAPVVDPVTGILRRVSRRPSVPPLPDGFLHLHAELPYLESIDPRFRPDLLAPAGVFESDASDPAALIRPAILSGIAHYCGADLGQGRRQHTSAAELTKAGERWFDLRDWEPHDPRLHAAPGFPFSPFDPTRVGEWVLGHDADGPVWAPLSLVHAGYLRDGDDRETATNANNLVGLHAGYSREEAIERACAHVLAHDAVAVWWSSSARAAEVPVPEVVGTAWGSSPLRVRILAIPSTFGVPVRLAVTDDAINDIVSLGFAAHSDPNHAAELATIEALIQHASAHDVMAEMSLIRNSAALGNGAVAGLARYDPERRYADAFGPNHRGLIDPMGHIQYGLDPSVVSWLRERTTPLPTRIELSPPSGSITAALRRTGTQTVVVDVTTDRLRPTGLHAVRVLIPGLARLQPAAYPLDPVGRTARARRALGMDREPTPRPYPGW